MYIQSGGNLVLTSMEKIVVKLYGIK